MNNNDWGKIEIYDCKIIDDMVAISGKILWPLEMVISFMESKDCSITIIDNKPYVADYYLNNQNSIWYATFVQDFANRIKAKKLIVENNEDYSTPTFWFLFDVENNQEVKDFIFSIEKIKSTTEDLIKIKESHYEEFNKTKEIIESECKKEREIKQCLHEKLKTIFNADYVLTMES